MTQNEIIQKLATKQAALINRTADCAVLRNEIAELKRQKSVLKSRENPVSKPPVKRKSKKKPLTK